MRILIAEDAPSIFLATPCYGGEVTIEYMKSVMALQYIAEGARKGERSIMLTLDEPRAQVLRNGTHVRLTPLGARFSDAVAREAADRQHERMLFVEGIDGNRQNQAVAGAIGAALFGLPVRTWFQQDQDLARLEAQLGELQDVNDELLQEVAQYR